MLPFVLLLSAMAIGPVFQPKLWEKHYPKVALGLASIIAIYLLVQQDTTSLLHAGHEYIGFITLIGSLFVVAGGIHLEIPGSGSPAKNVLFLLLGSLLANVLGTTGAAMLLIRPWLRLNRAYLAPHHVVFFIFLVANIGGCLTPIGDPPLFLGFLQGIPFDWVVKHCWPMWSVAVGVLLVMFYVIDKIHFGRAKAVSSAQPLKWQLNGLTNLFFLALILVAVFIEKPLFLREILMIAAAVGSYFTTKKSVHEANRFNFHPIQEVAILFVGIFVTMIPALRWLDGHAASLLGANPGAGIFYWGTGGLSSVLDNAPTYLGFLDALRSAAGGVDTAALLAQHHQAVLAISVGAVFFGAATYIGNGPNFMVKSLAESEGAATPTFLGYVWQFTIPLLAPVLVLVWLLFFRG